MIGASSRTRVAISAAGGTVVAALALAVVPAAHADDEAWGAIAVSPDGKNVGVATNQPNEYLANMAANNDCHQNNPSCNVLITFKAPDCGAVVKNGDQYFGDSGATQQEAEQNAMNQSPGSTVLRSACNNGSAGTSSTPTTAGTTPTSTSTPPAGG
jgi:hypothetical protein